MSAAVVRDDKFYEDANRALKVGYFVPVFIRLGASAVQVLAMSDEGWRLAHLQAEEDAGHPINPPSDKTRLMIVQVLRNRERELARASGQALPPKAVRSA